MMKKILFLLIVAFLQNTVSAQNLNLRINEVLASNRTGQMDDFFDRDDWFEIYNPPGNPITNLAGYYLSDTPNNLTKWQIPATNPGVTTMLPNSYKAFWADNDPQQGETHIGGFTLSVDGEWVILTAPDGVTIIDMVEFPELAPDISYGRECDGCTNWRFFNNVTYQSSNFEFQANNLLLINEVQTVNTTTIRDSQNEYDQWFEVYNPNPVQVNLANYYLSINGNPLQWKVIDTVPAKTIIPPNGFKIVWCDEDIIDGPNHAPFTLPLDGATIRLTSPDGTITYDTYMYSSIPENKSYGRQTDGSGNSIVFNNPTPTVTNTLVFIAPPNVLINEVLAANQIGIQDNAGEYEDWFELYNPTASPIYLGGCYISDNRENRTKWRVPVDFPDSVTIAPFSWLLFWADDDRNQGVRHTNFRLRNNKEYLGVFAPDGFSIADEIDWEYIAPDQSLGRLTDGSTPWVNFVETTPNASNNGATVQVVESAFADVTVFPNPAVDQLNFNTITDVTVYNLSGQQLASYYRVNQIDVSEWSSGIYLLKIPSGSTVRVMKF